jgi:5-(carboxyamino)imidazole ribonucleotide synthase
VINSLNKKIGVIGGGQLGKMLFEAGSPLNIDYTFIEKSAGCPASLVCANQIVGGLQDADAIEKLAERCDVLTYEIEHINVEKLLELEAKGVEIIPSPKVLQVIQDKGLQKEFYANNDLSTLPYHICSSEELAAAVNKWPDITFVLKHRKGGYDGKGVQVLTKDRFATLHENNDSSLLSEDGYVIEKFLGKVTEVSVIVAVGENEIAAYEPCEMVFDPRSNLMDYLIAPANLPKEVVSQCKSLAEAVVTKFQSNGLFAVELFVDENSEVYINEIAPRPHNSGHHTIESTYTSQYEQLNRILLSLPLGSTNLLCTAATANIVGAEDVNGPYYLDGIKECLKIEGVYIHMYGKATTSPFRKLGHFTVLGSNREEVAEKMKAIKAVLRIKSA